MLSTQGTLMNILGSQPKPGGLDIGYRVRCEQLVHTTMAALSYERLVANAHRGRARESFILVTT
jgi:hypothetical protein